MRLMPTTKDQPKCFAEVQRRRILDWTLDALERNDIDDICFIGGYRIEVVRQQYPQFTFRHNEDWPNNNIMESLMVAADLMDAPFVCCYSDTLITADLVAGIAGRAEDIVLSVDTDWLARYAFRTEHPPDDAEKVTVQNGRLTCVHRGIDPVKAHGEYTGVAKFSVAGAALLQQFHADRKKRYAGKPYREAKVFEKAYLIHLLQDMIESGVDMRHVDSAGEYMEIDTQQDFELAQTHWNPNRVQMN
jgi:choline kinase